MAEAKRSRKKKLSSHLYLLHHLQNFSFFLNKMMMKLEMNSSRLSGDGREEKSPSLLLLLSLLLPPSLPHLNHWRVVFHAVYLSILAARTVSSTTRLTLLLQQIDHRSDSVEQLSEPSSLTAAKSLDSRAAPGLCTATVPRVAGRGVAASVHSPRGIPRSGPRCPAPRGVVAVQSPALPRGAARRAGALRDVFQRTS